MKSSTTFPIGWTNSLIDEIKADTKAAIAIGPFGSRMKSDCYVERGVPVIRGTNLTGGRRFEGDFVYITEEKADELGSANVYKDDLVFPHRGAIGEVGIISENRHYVLSSSLMKLTCNKKKADPLFLYYFFKSTTGRHELLKNASQVGTPGIGQPLTSLKGIRLNLPPVNEQKIIAGILGSLDDKIELNRQINQTLEQIAQAIFKSWFVDFDPVKAKIRAKEQGRDPERAAMEAISDKAISQFTPTDQLAATAALFPDELVGSELGLIPKGWGETRIENVLELSYGKALKKTDRREGTIPVYGSGGITGFHDSHFVSGPGIIIGRKGTVGSLYWENDNFFPIDTVFYVQPLGDISLEYVYYLLQTLGLDHMNTDAAVPGLNRNNVYRLLLPNVSHELINHFTIVSRSLRDRIASNTKEISCLSEIRDTLLPKLLSGEIDLKNAKCTMELGKQEVEAL